MQGIFSCAFDQIDESNPIELVEKRRLREHINLDYKLKAYDHKHSGAINLLADVTAMANARGGYILIGVEEDREAPDGTPKRLVGIEQGDVEVNWIQSVCLSSIDEKINGLIDKTDKRHTIGGMAKRQFKLTEAEVNELKGAYQSCQDGQTKIRYQAVRLYGTGKKVTDIEEISGCSRISLMEWCRAYRQYGIAGLVDHRRGGNRAKLRGVALEQLQQQLEDYTPAQLLGVVNCYGDGQFWTVPDLAKLVERDYKVRYKSDTSYRHLFKRCNFSCQRPGSQYWSRNELAVLEFEQHLEKKS